MIGFESLWYLPEAFFLKFYIVSTYFAYCWFGRNHANVRMFRGLESASVKMKCKKSSKEDCEYGSIGFLANLY